MLSRKPFNHRILSRNQQLRKYPHPRQILSEDPCGIRMVLRHSGINQECTTPVSDCSVNPEQKGVLKMNMAVNIVQTKVTVGITVILTVLLCVPSVSADESLNQESTFRASPASDSEMIDRTDRLPEELEDIGVVEHLEAQVPLDITFRDEYGKDVKLGNYFQWQQAVLLTLVYSAVPCCAT